jgi:outer membrane biosynthesis protein TonB
MDRMQWRYGQMRRRGFWTSRGISVVAILALHGAVIGLLQLQRADRPEPVAALIHLGVISPRAAQASKPPELTARLEQPEVVLRLPADLIPDVEAESSALSLTVTQDYTPPDSQADATPASGQPLVVSRVEYLRAPVPRYPPAARRGMQEGLAQIRVVVGEDGRPQGMYCLTKRLASA